MYKVLFPLIATVALMPITAMAQTTPTADDAVAAAKNQLGVLEYCQGKGFVDADTVAIQTKMLGYLPQPTDAAKVDAAYAKGKAGTVSAMGQEMGLAAAATQQGSTEEAMCKQIGAAVQAAGAQLPK